MSQPARGLVAGVLAGRQGWSLPKAARGGAAESAPVLPIRLGRTWRSGARIFGMFCFGGVVAVFLDRFGAFVFPLMLFVSGCGALVLIVRDARTALVEEGFNADDARRLTWASVPVTLSLRVFRLALARELPRAVLIDLGRAVVDRARLRASSARSGS